ncbi:hypothetical protein [Vibrio cortegadensis]|uniref:hypothetical protein n=1 Tax=Vibrio cortegadensis TaxID=1328770 RepID=UPI00352CC0EE
MKIPQDKIDQKVSFLIGSLTFFPIHLVGTLRGGELLALLILPFYLVKRFYKLNNRVMKTIVICLFLWLAAQVISDLYNNVTQINAMKGSAHIIFVITNFIFFYLLFSRDCKNFVWYVSGLFVSGVCNAIFVKEQSIANLFVEDRFWYTSVAPFAFPLIVLSTYKVYPKYKKTACGILFFYGTLALLLQGRSDALISYIGCFLLYFSGSNLMTKMSLSRLLSLGIVGFTVVYLTFISYVTLGINGHLGRHSEQQLAKLPDPYSLVDTLLVGRSESFFAFSAIADKPILGHGSGAERDKYIGVWELKMSKLQHDSSITYSTYDNGYNAIPTHSVILYAWVFSGIMGFICWVTILYYVLRTGLVILKGEIPFMVPISAIYIALLSWHLLFSPHGHARFTWPAYMAFSIIGYYHCLRKTGK